MDNYKRLIAYRIYIQFLDRLKEEERNHNTVGHTLEKEKELVKAIENDLRLHGFSQYDIYKLWLIQQGYEIFQILDYLGAPNFFKFYPTAVPNQLCDDQKKKLWKEVIREMIKEFDWYLANPSQWGHFSTNPNLASFTLMDGTEEIYKMDDTREITKPDGSKEIIKLKKW